MFVCLLVLSWPNSVTEDPLSSTKKNDDEAAFLHTLKLQVGELELVSVSPHKKTFGRRLSDEIQETPRAGLPSVKAPVCFLVGRGKFQHAVCCHVLFNSPLGIFGPRGMFKFADSSRFCSPVAPAYMQTRGCLRNHGQTLISFSSFEVFRSPRHIQ